MADVGWFAAPVPDISPRFARNPDMLASSAAMQ
jgi:hypothetical protein